MTDWKPYWYLCMILALAACVPAVSVLLNRRRERRLAANPPTDVLKELFAQGFAPEDALLGVPQSNKWLTAGLLLQDSGGRSVGCVHYGWREKVWIELGDRTYHVRACQPRFTESELIVDEQVLASGRRGLLATEPSHFDVPGLGALTVDAGLKSHFKSDFPIVCQGRTIGRVMDTGKVLSGHRALLLRGDFSLAVRAYILALEYRRMC